MAGQEHLPAKRDAQDPGAAPDAALSAASAAAAQLGKQAGDLDSLLDEIDDLLTSNAEEFVRGFVQKGGQ